MSRINVKQIVADNLNIDFLRSFLFYERNYKSKKEKMSTDWKIDNIDN